MTAVDALTAGLGLDPEEAQTRFDGLQEKLVPLWQLDGPDDPRRADDRRRVLDVAEDPNWPAAVKQAYEERFLFLLLLLRQPRARLVYVTSQAIHPSIVDYYLSLLPGIIPSQAGSDCIRLAARRLDTAADREAPRAAAAARAHPQPRSDPDRAHLVPFNMTELERDLALALGIPMYAADPSFFPFGTKSGCRRLFAEQGVPTRSGARNCPRVEEVAPAIARAARGAPGHRRGAREAERRRLGGGKRARQTSTA